MDGWMDGWRGVELVVMVVMVVVVVVVVDRTRSVEVFERVREWGRGGEEEGIYDQSTRT